MPANPSFKPSRTRPPHVALMRHIPIAMEREPNTLRKKGISPCAGPLAEGVRVAQRGNFDVFGFLRARLKGLVEPG